MKNLFLLMGLFLTIIMHAQNVGIGTGNPSNSAALDITSTTSGLLPPRMTFAQRNAISNPATGLVIWCIDCDELQVYNGTIWKNLMGGAASFTSPPFVTTCDQDWMVRNLDVSTYRNGDPIPKVTEGAVWASLTTGAYCYFNNDSAMYAATYGKLYNWYAVNDPRGIAPVGWHIPTDAEYTTLDTCFGGNAIAGGPMKEIGTTHWTSPNSGATNLSGFTGLPGGYRNANSTFFSLGIYGIWWTSTESPPNHALDRYLDYDEVGLYSYADGKRFGFSVRCVRD